MGRSGTTLIEKLLTNHPDVDILSQPFPILFTDIKKMFLKTRGLDEYYVLNDHKDQMQYPQHELDNYLLRLTLSEQCITNLFIKMHDYSGQSQKPNNIDLSKNLEKNLIGFWHIYKKAFDYFDTKKSTYVGSKEIMCEEFIPYLIKNNLKSILIVRDPRDVLASSNYPKKDKYIGEKKPALFTLRTWKKSIKYVNLLKEDKNFCYIKYEDLVTRPYEIIDIITTFLDIPHFKKDHFSKGIYDRDGCLWEANTSLNTTTSFISTKSIGSYKTTLSNEEINYVESICKSEMEFMGYGFETTPNKEIITKFKDYGVMHSPHLNKDFSSLEENINKEIEVYSNGII